MTTRPPIVVHVTTTDVSLDWLLGNQLVAFQRAGYDVVGVSAAGPHVERLTARGIRHIALRHATRAPAPGQDALALVELVRLFRQLRPDIVHTHNPKPGVYGRIAGRVARVPVVVNTVHGLYAQPGDALTRRSLVYGLERVAASFSDAELVQNPEDVETLVRLRIPRDRLALLGNGIDLDRFDPARVTGAERAAARAELVPDDAPGTVLVGLVGRLVREKGFPEVFRAATAVREHVPEVRFAVVGDDEPDKPDALTPDDRAPARAAGVVFAVARADVTPYYAAMDCFVLASHREGFPRAAMEAAAMGLPIVTTNIRGCRQVVDDGRNGILVPVRDAAALAAAITRLATDSGLRAEMGAAGRAKALRDFDERRCIDITLETYARLLARRAPARVGR